MDNQLRVFPDIVSVGSNSSRIMFVDANILANFDRVGRLDALLAAKRVLIVTPEVYTEAVRNAIKTNDPDKVASGQRIDSWIQSNADRGNIRTGPVDQNRPVETGEGAGERSISADVRSLNGQGDPVVLSDDNSMALRTVAGSAMPALTGNYYLGSLLIGGAITPNDYFQMSGAGTAAGFNQKAFRTDTSSVYLNGREYGLIIGGVQRGTVQYTTVGSSLIKLDGRPLADCGPYERVGIQNGEIVRFNSDGSRKLDLNENELPLEQSATLYPWQDFGALGLPGQPGGFNQYDSGNPFLVAPMLTSGSMLGPNYFPGSGGSLPAFADGSAGPAFSAGQPDAQFPSLLPLYASQPAIDPATFLGLSPAQDGLGKGFGLLGQTNPLPLSRPPPLLGDLLEELLQGPRGNGGAAPGNPFDWPQSNPTGYDWLAPPLVPSWTIPEADPVGSAGAFPAPPPQTQMTPQQVPAPPPSPFGVPVPPALLPLVEHFFPQWLDTNNAQAWPSSETSDDPGMQPNLAGSSTGAGLGLAVGGQLAPQPFAAPSSPFSVPVPPALQPLVPHFFPQWLDTSKAQAWPSAGTSVDAGTQPNPAGSAGAGLGLASRGQLTPQPFPASPASPLDVPIPESLRPLLRLFFP